MKWTKKNKTIGFIIFIGMAAIMLSSGLIADLNLDAGLEKDLITYTLYDADGNPIPTGLLSIVGGTENVHGISFDVNVKNIGEIPITVAVVSAQPIALQNALSSANYVIVAGETKTISSDIVSTTDLESMTQPVSFGVDITGSYVYGGVTNTLPTKSGSMDITITKDPVIGFDVDFVSSSGIYSYCIPGTYDVTPTLVTQCNSDGTEMIPITSSYGDVTKSCAIPGYTDISNDYTTCGWYIGDPYYKSWCDVYKISTNELYISQGIPRVNAGVLFECFK